MNPIKQSVIYALSATLISGCAGAVKVTNPASFSEIRGSTITVSSRSPDPEGVRGLIEQSLIEKDYNVVSEEIARAETRIDANSSRTGAGQQNSSAVLYNQTLVKSTYILSFTYATRPDFPHGVVIRSLSASIIDLRTGAVKSSLRFSQGEFGSTSTDGAVQELLEQM